MIIIDILLNPYNVFVFLPFLTYLVKEKISNIFYFISYGILLDIIMLNIMFLNTVIMLFTYYLKKKTKRKNHKYLFMLVLNMIILSNTLLFQNFGYILSINYLLTIVFNYLFFIVYHKNSFF